MRASTHPPGKCILFSGQASMIDSNRDPSWGGNWAGQRALCSPLISSTLASCTQRAPLPRSLELLAYTRQSSGLTRSPLPTPFSSFYSTVLLAFPSSGLFLPLPEPLLRIGASIEFTSAQSWWRGGSLSLEVREEKGWGPALLGAAGSLFLFLLFFSVYVIMPTCFTQQTRLISCPQPSVNHV